MGFTEHLAYRHVVMQVPLVGTTDTPAILRLTIDTDRPVRLSDIARIFDHLPIAFDRHISKIGEHRAELRIADLRVGSMSADFMVFAGAAVTLWDFRGILVSFVQALIGAFEVMRGGDQTKKVTAPDRRLIEALAAPIATDNATQVCLQVFGENATIFIMDTRSVAELMPRTTAAVIRPQRSGGAYSMAAVSYYYGKWWAHVQSTGEELDLRNPEFMEGRSRDFHYDVEGEVQGGAGRKVFHIRHILSSS